MLTLAMLNGLLVGGAILPSWKMMEFVNGKDYPVYEMENKNVWNHRGILYPSEKYWKNLVTWDDDIPNWMEK